MKDNILKFLTQEHNINNFELGLFIIAGGLLHLGYLYYAGLSLLALVSVIYRDYNKNKIIKYHDINKNKY